MKKRITFYCDSMDIGGTEKATLDLVNNLSEEKYDIRIVQLTPGGIYHKKLKKHIKTRSIVPISPKTSFTYYWRFRNLFHKLPVDLMHRIFIGNKQDIEIACGYGYPTVIVSKAPNAKKIAWIHMDVSLDRNKVAEMSYEEGREYFKDIDEFVCVSYDCAKKFNEKFGFEDKTKVCYNILPVDEIIEKAKEEPSEVFDKEYINIVSVGRLTWQKGFDVLINVISKLINEGAKIKLYIVGKGEDYNSLNELIKNNNMSENIKLLGYVENPYALMNNADLYVCSSRHESFSLTVAESLILGTPVVSTRCTGPIELLDGGIYGLLVDNNEESLYEGVKRLVTSEEERMSYKNKAMERKSFFDTKNAIQVWEKILDN